MIIGEIGINHEGSEDVAGMMLNSLINSSLDGITFQIPSKDYLNSKEPKRTPLSNSFYKRAIQICHEKEKEIGFACSDIETVQFLDSCGADFWKTLSIDIKNKKLLDVILETGKQTFISTGTSGIEEIKKINLLQGKIKFIHTQISNDIEKVNLKAIDTIRSITKKEVAFGLHCSEIRVLYLSSLLRPSDIFFYVKRTSSNKYPDGPHAIVIDDIDNVINDFFYLGKSLGDGKKNEIKPAWS